jgi:hypothetical protein
VGSVGKRVRLLALDGRNAELAGGLSSNPILSGPRRTDMVLLTGGKFAASVHDSDSQVPSVSFTPGASFVANILANFGGKINGA